MQDPDIHELDTQELDTSGLATRALDTEALDTEALDTEALDTENDGAGSGRHRAPASTARRVSLRLALAALGLWHGRRVPPTPGSTTQRNTVPAGNHPA